MRCRLFFYNCIFISYLVTKDCKNESEAKAARKEIVNSTTNEQDTPLHIAAQIGYEEIVKTLINLGADVNARKETNQTPLHLAAIAGHLSIVKFLVMNKSKVNAKDNQQQTALHKLVWFLVFCSLISRTLQPCK